MFYYNQYVRAQSLDEAYELYQKKPNFVLGGMLWLKMKNKTLGTAIDLCDLGLDQIYEDENEFRIGAYATLRQIDVLRFFDIFVCGDMGLKSKPAPDIFLACADKMGLVPADCFVLEDSINGIKAAHAAGMKPVMIPDMIAPTEEIMPMLYALKPSLVEAAELF